LALSLLLDAFTARALIVPPPPRSNLRDVVVDEALTRPDGPYRYQGEDSTGFDASGLVQHIFKRNGSKRKGDGFIFGTFEGVLCLGAPRECSIFAQSRLQIVVCRSVVLVVAPPGSEFVWRVTPAA